MWIRSGPDLSPTVPGVPLVADFFGQYLERLEKYLVESVAKHDSHQVTFEARLDSITDIIADNFCKHTAAVDATNVQVAANYEMARDAQGNLGEAIDLCGNIFQEHASRL